MSDKSGFYEMGANIQRMVVSNPGFTYCLCRLAYKIQQAQEDCVSRTLSLTT